MRDTYPGTRGLMGRRELKNLKRTTLMTFFKVADFYGWKSGVHFTYREQAGTIEWWNGGEILLMDLGYMPSDPLYLRLGGLELTDAFVDESNEVRANAIEILKTRIGRQKNKEFSLIPKLFETFNPDKGHVYSRYYKPFKDGKLPDHRKFVPALAGDNPHLPPEYVEQLKKADKVTRERLLYGNFDYDDDPSKLMELDAILDLFTNKAEKSDKKFISCDVARFGEDKTVICLWHGLDCVETKSYKKTAVDEVVALLNNLCEVHHVRRSHVIIDEDGVGGGVVDTFKGGKGFVNNSKAIRPYGKKDAPNYSNLKTQCYFEFSKLVNSGKISIGQISAEDKENLIEELEQVKQKDIDKDGKIRLVGKEAVKENIGRSPDISDALMMRMYFEIKKPPSLKPIFIN